MARPVSLEAARDSEPDRDLNSELFSAKLEDAPSEALKINALPAT